MEKRLLTFGYNITSISEFDNRFSYSNYSIQFNNEKRWKKKLTDIEEYINRNELQCILIVVSRKFLSETASIENNKLEEFFSVCSKTNCIIAIQEYLLEEIPLIYDYYTDKKLSITELESIIKQVEEGSLEYISSHKVNQRKLDYLIEELDIDSEELASRNNTNTLESYKRKYELLKETELLFPRIKELIALINSNFENIVTFRFLNQIHSIIKDELIEQFSNEILNIYIPRQYGFRFEFDDFIQLFEKYLKTVEQLNISIEINETSQGVNYKFISVDKIDSTLDLPNKFQRFTSFIDLCEKEPESAMCLLESKKIPPTKSLEIIQRLSKKYKRLMLDIQQQQERLELAYKQDIQSELFEYGYIETPFSLVQDSFSVKKITDIYNPNEHDKKIIEIIQNHESSYNIDNIKSNLGILKDQELSIDDRKKSAYKISKTLRMILRKGVEYTEKIAIETLLAYINSKLN